MRTTAPHGLKLALLSLLLFSGNASAEGSTEYHQCVLKQMKGQVKYVIHHARSICESRFPYEKKLSPSHGDIKTRWWKDDGKFFVQITQNLTDYKITKIKVNFHKSCSSSYEEEIMTQVGFTFYFDGLTASRDTGKYQSYSCMSSIPPKEYHGIKKR